MLRKSHSIVNWLAYEQKRDLRVKQKQHKNRMRNPRRSSSDWLELMNMTLVTRCCSCFWSAVAGIAFSFSRTAEGDYRLPTPDARRPAPAAEKATALLSAPWLNEKKKTESLQDPPYARAKVARRSKIIDLTLLIATSGGKAISYGAFGAACGYKATGHPAPSTADWCAPIL